MSIAERKQEEKQEMHQRILNGARKVFLEKGYEKASMRNIANEINYSPGTIYFHFKDKSEIFQELHNEGFTLLVDQLKVLTSVADPFERLKATGRVYIKFAQENKDYYNLMFMVNETVEAPTEGKFQIAQEAINHLHAVISECQKQGRFKDMDTDYFTFMIISAMHGICALFCKDRMANFVDKTDDELMENGYECFVALLEKG
ncbi:MAG: TetR/AcrR family transcriptional regulator [Candidatus Chryseobacterium colombiense]|nr:TetR/AcrR family transcriptional regulator [Chryseobacterium sp.]WEK71435.1 MAG: TetR/AcrR family transcriptional regulator [Chryseobacterium sp.]